MNYTSIFLDWQPKRHDPTELLHGTLDALILKALGWGPRRGYAIARAVILGALGERERAVELLRQSAGEGSETATWHYAAHFNPRPGYPPFEELIRPQR